MADEWWVLCPGGDGARDATHSLREEVTELGRNARGLSFPDDIYMADHHASLVFEDGDPYVADSGKGTGVWLRAKSADGLELEEGAQVCVGSQILLVGRRDGRWELVHYGSDGARHGRHLVPEAGLEVGREAELSLATHDDVLSRRHARFACPGGRLRVVDCDSRNGTWIKVRGAAPLEEGDEFRIETRSFHLARARGEG